MGLPPSLVPHDPLIRPPDDLQRSFIIDFPMHTGSHSVMSTHRPRLHFVSRFYVLFAHGIARSGGSSHLKPPRPKDTSFDMSSDLFLSSHSSHLYFPHVVFMDAWPTLEAFP